MYPDIVITGHSINSTKYPEAKYLQSTQYWKSKYQILTNM